MTFPENAVLDNFNRADENLDESSNWTSDVFNEGSAGGLQVLSQEVINGSESRSTAYWAAESFGADQEVFFTLNTLADNNESVWLFLRISDPGTFSTVGYAVEFQYNVEQSVVKVYQVYYNFFTVQLGDDIDVLFGPGAVVGARAVGNEICVFIDGENQGTFEDDTYNQAGYIGIAIEDNIAAIDNFGGGAATEACSCTQVSSVSIARSGEGKVNTDITLTATITPTGATVPVTYTWSSDGLQSGQGTATAVYKWTTPVIKTVTLTAANDCSSASDSERLRIWSFNREIPRDEIARLLTVGLGTDVQNVVNYESADFEGKTTVVLVTSRASQRPKITMEGRRVYHKYDILVFVLYAKSGEWTELQAEDRLDYLENEIWEILNEYTSHRPYWNGLSVANENGFSNITYPVVGGSEYKMETFTVDVVI